MPSHQHFKPSSQGFVSNIIFYTFAKMLFCGNPEWRNLPAISSGFSLHFKCVPLLILLFSTFFANSHTILCCSQTWRCFPIRQYVLRRLDEIRKALSKVAKRQRNFYVHGNPKLYLISSLLFQPFTLRYGWSFTNVIVTSPCKLRSRVMFVYYMCHVLLWTDLLLLTLA